MICVIQFDAADVGLLERLTAEGRLPNLASLGGRRPLKSPAVDGGPASYRTLYTGLEPGDHGHYYPFHWHAPAGRIVFGDPDPVAPVWERVSVAGRRVLIVDAYESPKPRSLPNGSLLSGVGFAERVVLPRRASSDESGRAALRAVGRSPTVSETFGRSTEAELEALAGHLESAAARTAGAAVAALRRGSYDLVWTCFSAGHIGGHLLRAPEGGGGTLERIYEAADHAIGELLAALPDSAQPIAISPLGMDRNSSRVDLMPGMLDAVLRGRVPEAGGPHGLWQLRSVFSPRLRGAIATAMPDAAALALTARLETRAIDRNAEAFAVPADGHGFIRLNLRGREPAGVVEPGDVDELCTRIEAGLRSFEDIDGGRSVSRVVRTAESYPGARSSWLPDLIVGWTDVDAVGLKGVVSRELGELRRAGVGSGRVGNHPERSDAWVAGGEGEVDLAALDGIADLAPAISASLGAGPSPVPSNA